MSGVIRLRKSGFGADVVAGVLTLGPNIALGLEADGSAYVDGQAGGGTEPDWTLGYGTYDARYAPLTHASRHASGGADPITPAMIGAASATHTHSIAQITGLQAALDGKAAVSHSHTISQVTGLQAALDGKAAASHTHTAGQVGAYTIAEVNNLLAGKANLTGATFTGTVTAPYINAAIARTGDGGVNTSNAIILYPEGGALRVNTSDQGAIKIRLPVLWTNTMIRMRVEVHRYTGPSYTLWIEGYNYSTNSTWQNVDVQTNATTENVTVRFGHDGVRSCIWIGNTDTTWSYPFVRIAELQTSHSSGNSVTTWRQGWEMSLVQSFDTVQVTQTVGPLATQSWANARFVLISTLDTELENYALADHSHGATTHGDILWYDGTQLTRLAIGAAGRVLTSAGPGNPPSWAPPPGLSFANTPPAGNRWYRSASNQPGAHSWSDWALPQFGAAAEGYYLRSNASGDAEWGEVTWSDIKSGIPVYATRWPTLVEIGAADAATTWQRGTNGPTLQSFSGDLNDASGFHAFYASTSSTNRPPSGNSNIIGFGIANYTTQLAARNNWFYIRQQEAGVWGPWRQIAERDWALAQFAPMIHTHTISEVTGLQAALDGMRDWADGRFVALAGSYSNPSWLTALAASKLLPGVLGAGDYSLQATRRLYFDGGGDTYWQEVSANQLRAVVGGVERLRITTTGATFSQTVYAPNMHKTSARWLKQDIEDLPLDEARRVLNLRLRKYRWRKTGALDWGWIADEVDPMFRTAQLDAVYTDMIHAATLRIVQDHEARIEALEKENAMLRQRLNEMARMN